MADRAAFAHGRVFKNERPGLFPMALGARFIQPRHGQSARRFHDVQAVRVVALDTVHLSLKHWIDDELVQPARAAQGDVLAARSVAGFASGLAGHRAVFQMQARVRTGGKSPGDAGVAVRAGFVPHKGRAFNLQGHHHGAIRRGTGIEKQHPGARNQHQSGQTT